MTDVVELWEDRLQIASFPIGRGIRPELLADRYDAETEDEIEELTGRAAVELLNTDYEVLTLEEMDTAAERMKPFDEDAANEIKTDGGEQT